MDVRPVARRRAVIDTRAIVVAGLIVLIAVSIAWAQTDPLPSWNEGPAKQSILIFVQTVTGRSSPLFVPPERRIATFDNDGTLWSEQPIYFQLAFALDRVRALAPKHPAWKTTQPFKAVLDDDMKAVATSGQKGMVEMLLATHTGMTTEEFTKTVVDWIATAQHPRFKRPYTQVIYQPMVELLAYLRANGFKTYIVSGGTVEFMRPWTEQAYGIPPEQVIGTSFVTTYKLGNDGQPLLFREPKLDFVDDGPGKPVGIQKVIGRRPLLAFGNSDGDQQMLQWTAAGEGARFMGIVHHTDDVREWAYDRQSHIGRLDKALDEAKGRGWTVVDMKADWKKIFAFE
jgi:phosphoglycolate phosphatase-like HAD superfamily hydrolase